MKINFKKIISVLEKIVGLINTKSMLYISVMGSYFFYNYMDIIRRYSPLEVQIVNKVPEKVDYIEKLFPVKAIGEIFLKLFISIIFSIIIVKIGYFISSCLKKIWINKKKKDYQKKMLKNLCTDEINLLKRFIVEDVSTIYEDEKEIGISSLIRKGIIVQGVSISIGKNQYHLEEWVKEEMRKDEEKRVYEIFSKN